MINKVEAKVYEPSEEFIQKYKDFFLGSLEKTTISYDNKNTAFFIYLNDEKNNKRKKELAETFFLENYEFFKKETKGFDFINLPLNNQNNFEYQGNPWVKEKLNNGNYRAIKNENSFWIKKSIVIPVKLFEYYFHGLPIEKLNDGVDFSFLNNNTYYFGKKEKNTWTHQAFYHNDVDLTLFLLNNGVSFFNKENKEDTFLDKLLDLNINLSFLSKSPRDISEIKKIVWSQLDKKDFIKDPLFEYEQIFSKMIEKQCSFYDFKNFSLDFFSYFKKTFFQCEDDDKTINDLIVKSLIDGDKDNLILLSNWISIHSRLFNYFFFDSDNRRDLFEDDFRKKIIGDFGDFIEEGFKAFSINNYIEKNQNEKVKNNWFFFIDYFINTEKEIVSKVSGFDIFSNYNKNFEKHFISLNNKSNLEKSEEKYFKNLFSNFDKSLLQLHKCTTAFFALKTAFSRDTKYVLSDYQDTILSNNNIQSLNALFKEIKCSIEGVNFLKKNGFYEKAEDLNKNISLFNPIKKIFHEEKIFSTFKDFLEAFKKDRNNLLNFYKKDYEIVFEKYNFVSEIDSSNKDYSKKSKIKFPNFYKYNELSDDFIKSNKEETVNVSKSISCINQSINLIHQVFVHLSDYELREGNDFLLCSQQITKEEAKKHLFKYAFHLNKKSLFNFKKESVYHLISINDFYSKLNSWIIFSRNKIVDGLIKKNDSLVSDKELKIKVNEDKVLNSINYIVSDVFNYTSLMMNKDNFKSKSNDFLYIFFPEISNSLRKEKIFMSEMSKEFKGDKLLKKGIELLDNLADSILIASFYNYQKRIVFLKEDGCSENDLLKENEQFFNQIKLIKEIDLNNFISKFNGESFNKFKKDLFLDELDDKFFSSDYSIDNFFKFIEKETLKNASLSSEKTLRVEKKNTTRF